MRQIGHLPEEARAQGFSDLLIAKGIRNQIERDGENSWSVWVLDEDQIAAAQTWLEQFRAQPDAPEFRNAATSATKMREAEAQDLAAYRKRIRTRQSMFPKLGGYGVGILTCVLIAACVFVAFYSNLGENHDFLRRLLISDPEGGSGKFLPEVFAGEVWRLFTPIFIHFGIVHLLFNMMWLYQLGSMIEARQSAWRLAALVAVIAGISNFAQYYLYHPGFGGMSGVIYGLAGYVWMRGRYDRASGLFLDQQSVTILLVWLVICFTNYFGPVANAAHLAGLIVGVVWGRGSAFLASRKPE